MPRTIHSSLLLCLLVVLIGAPSALADNVQLSVNSTGLGAALVLRPTGQMLSCTGTRCSYEFARDTRVSVTARPSSFARWREACTHAAPTCVVALDRNRSLTARFTPVALYIASPSRDAGSVNVDPPVRSRCGSGCWAYPYATQVTVKAEAAPKHAFTGWSGLPCGPVAANVCSVSLLDNTDVIPQFKCTGTGEEDCTGQAASPIEREVITKVRVVGGKGSVQMNGSSCRRTCSLPIRRGTVVVLRADRTGFKSWSGSCSGKSPLCQLAAFRDARGRLPQVTATFK
jgi:Divergent InlB B-repeat domain